MEYTVIRSKRKTIALLFDKNGKLQVRVPYFVPKSAVISFVEAHRDWIERHAPLFPPKAYSAEEILQMKDQTKGIVFPLLEKYTALMGVRPAKVTITSARTRFGSCSAKGNLCFSCFLCLYPTEAIEYVVVHELAHLVHHDHSAAFHALVEKYLPDQKQRRAKLRNKGGQLR